jgi:hypothetical protein
MFDEHRKRDRARVLKAQSFISQGARHLCEIINPNYDLMSLGGTILSDDPFHSCRPSGGHG